MRRTFADAAHEAEFRREGFVVLDLLTKDDVDRLLAVYAEFRTAHENDGFTPTVLIDDLDLRRRVHDAVAPVLLERLDAVLDDHRLAVASYAVKQAGSGTGYVGLHQDLTFVDEREYTGVSVWSPLIDVGPENGWLGLARGSHVFNSHYREPCGLPYRDLADIIQERYLSYLPLRAGQMVLMDNRVIHGSPPNRSAHARIVAAGVAVPRESELFYCHRDLAGDASQLELWQVPADFYVRHLIGQRPAEGHLVATVPRTCAPLSEAQLHAYYAARG